MKSVYTLEDLRNADSVSGEIFTREEKPARLAVIGDPIAHSKSPELHQPALDKLELNMTYIRVHLTAEEFDEGLGLLKNLGFIGCNVTVPHKERALAWVGSPSSFASQVGVANTILFEQNTCYSTDPIGLESALKEVFGFDVEGKSIFILGAGGGAGSAVAQYLISKPVGHLFLYNRTPEKLDAVYENIINLGDADLTKLSLYGGSDFPAMEEIDLIINATSLGLKEGQASPISQEHISGSHLVYDMTYGCENQLSKICTEKGANYSDGLSMLRHQGAEAFKLWFPGSDPSAHMGLK